ncbi:MAG: hypothetical protein ACMUHM_03145 [Thermoplasmatota archaeon]
MSEERTNIVLPLVLAGAILLSTIGFMGLILSMLPEREDENGGIGNEVLVSKEFEMAEGMANEQFENSLDQGELAKQNAPSRKPLPSSKGFQQPGSGPVTQGADQGKTRSEDELLSQEGYVEIGNTPKAPAVEMEETFDLLNGKGDILISANSNIQSGEAPDEFVLPDLGGDPEVPVNEDGVMMDTDKISDIEGDLDDVSDEIGGYLGEYSPGTTTAGMSEEDVQGVVWTISNRTTRDSDLDGNPEYINDLRVSSGHRNDTLINGALTWIVGFNYIYEDTDSDGVPNREEVTIVKFANYTIAGNKVAEGISYSNLLKNDTDGDGVIDRVEIRHLSYGYRMTILGGIKSYATAGELVMTDSNADGIFEDKEGTAVFYFKHEMGSPLVTVRESVVILHGKDSLQTDELSKLAFTRVNNTSGKTILEMGYGWTVKVQGNTKNLVIVAAHNNTLTGRLQYVIFNGTETKDAAGTTYRVTAFAVDNRTLLLGGKRSDFAAVDYTVTIGTTQRTDKGTLAVARIEDRPNRDTESYMWINVDRKAVNGSLEYENITIVAGHNVTAGSSLNSTTGLVVRVFQDSDRDGNPEYLKEAVALVIAKDTNSDGVKEWEGYAAHSKELWDSDSDGNIERNFTFFVMGFKDDPDGDGNINTDRSLMISINRTDANSNGFFELEEEAYVGSLKKDDDSDGTLDAQRTVGKWVKRTDVNDDGTEINEQSGTWTDES